MISSSLIVRGKANPFAVSGFVGTLAGIHGGAHRLWKGRSEMGSRDRPPPSIKRRRIRVDRVIQAANAVCELAIDSLLTTDDFDVSISVVRLNEALFVWEGTVPPQYARLVYRRVAEHYRTCGWEVTFLPRGSDEEGSLTPIASIDMSKAPPDPEPERTTQQ